MDIFKTVKDILMEILDIEEVEITPDTYLIRELDAESIDLLELAVSLNSHFNIEVNDDKIFLAKLRLHVNEAEQQGIALEQHLAGSYPFLSNARLQEIINDLEGGATLKVKDLVSYVAWQCEKG